MSVKQTPLYDEHVALGGRMVEFAGYRLPVQYDGLMAEHHAVRQRCGLFDVSHMGEIEILGARALDACQWLVCGDVAGIADGQALYTGLLNPQGGFVDDLIVYRFSPERLFLVVNAANHSTDLAWIQSQVRERFADGARVADRHADYAQIAFQGPAAASVMAPLCSAPVDDSHLEFFHFVESEVCGQAAIVGRTGYTGEDGFEIYCAPEAAVPIWRGLLDAGRQVDAKPAGLGARDTLRLEAKLALYGNDIDAEHSPLEASLGWIIDWDKGEFCGRQALRAQKQDGIERKLVGLHMIDRGIPRHGYNIVDEDGGAIGVVTSGTQSPTLGQPIALAYVPKKQSKLGREHWVEIRGKKLRAQIVKTPFYRRPKKPAG